MTHELMRALLDRRGEGDEARAFWVVEPGRGEIRDEDLGEPAGDAVVVQALYSGISRGTEALVFEGRVPQTEFARMRAPFQAGEFPARQLRKSAAAG